MFFFFNDTATTERNRKQSVVNAGRTAFKLGTPLLPRQGAIFEHSWRLLQGVRRNKVLVGRSVVSPSCDTGERRRSCLSSWRFSCWPVAPPRSRRPRVTGHNL